MMDAAPETFWQRFWATYRFRRNFGRERWWHSFYPLDPECPVVAEFMETLFGDPTMAMGALVRPV
jgi:hypothetical protein